MFSWGNVVPIHAGINIALHEIAPVVTDSQSTCTDPGDDSSSDDDVWSRGNETEGNDSPLLRSASSYEQVSAHSLLQRSARLLRREGRWTNSFAVAAAQKLPPPGNGKKGSVSFSEEVEVEGQVLPDMQGNEFWQGLCSNLIDEIDQSTSAEAISFAEEFMQTAVRRVCLSEESDVAGPSSEEKWTERFRIRQHELGIEGVPAFLQAPEGLLLQTPPIWNPVEVPLDADAIPDSTTVMQAHIMTPVGPF